MSTVQTIRGIEARLKSLAGIRANHDPGAGLNVTVNNPGSDKHLELQIADGDAVLAVLEKSLKSSHRDLLTLARMDLKELQAFLAAYPKED